MQTFILAALLAGCTSSESVKESVKAPDPMAEKRAKAAELKAQMRALREKKSTKKSSVGDPKRNQIASITANPNGVLRRRGDAPSSVTQTWKYVVNAKFPDLSREYKDGFGWLEDDSPEDLPGKTIPKDYKLQIDLPNGLYYVEIGVEGSCGLLINGAAIKRTGKVFSKQKVTNGKITITNDPTFTETNTLTYFKVHAPVKEEMDNKPKTYIFRYD